MTVVLGGTFKGIFGGAGITDRRFGFFAGTMVDLRDAAIAAGTTDFRFKAAFTAVGLVAVAAVPTLGAGGIIDVRLGPTLIESPITSSLEAEAAAVFDTGAFLGC